MESIKLREIRKDLKILRKDVAGIKAYMEESNLELTDSVKKQIRESRKRDKTKFLSQEEVERRFL